MSNPFEKYKNPDPRCEYCFTPDPVGYCWSYANYVDGLDPKKRNKYSYKFDDIKTICLGCEDFYGSPAWIKEKEREMKLKRRRKSWAEKRKKDEIT